MSKNWLLRLGIVAVAAGAAFLAWQFFKPEGLPEGFASSNGRIEATEIDVAAKIAGRVEEVLADEGDFVTAGQVLAKMDTDVLEAQRREAEAQLQQALIGIETAKSLVTQREAEKAAAQAELARQEAELTVAQRTLARAESAGGGAVALQVIDEHRARAEGAQAAVSAAKAQVAGAEAASSTARSEVIGAQAAVAATRATIERIQADIDDSTLRSPRDGRVQYRVAEPGEVLAAGGVVLNLVDLADVYMTFFLPTAEAGRVALGTEVRLVLDAVPAIRHPGAGDLRRRRRPVHAQDRGDGRRAPEADVPDQGADRPRAASEVHPRRQDRVAGCRLCAAPLSGRMAARAAGSTCRNDRSPAGCHSGAQRDGSGCAIARRRPALRQDGRARCGQSGYSRPAAWSG